DTQYKKFIEKAQKSFQSWLAEFTAEFGGLTKGSKPKLVIEKMAESLLESSSKLELLDPYAIYQALMSYWTSTLQDDAFLIAAVGWLEAAQLHVVVDASDGVDATAGKTKFRSDLLPAYLLIDHYLPIQRDALADSEAVSAFLQAEIDALVEEQGGDEGLINEALSDAGKVNKKQLTSRIKEITGQADFADELAVLQQCAELVEKLDLAKQQMKTLQGEINDALIAKYKALDEAEVKKLALIKWETALTESLETDRARVSQRLMGRIAILGDRYQKTLPDLVAVFNNLDAAVQMHLQNLGLEL
ncbi:MAG: hypothetical protein D4R50_02420, partial [Actinomycetales bacterium]